MPNASQTANMRVTTKIQQGNWSEYLPNASGEIGGGLEGIQFQ
jgi:hypothetical protein